MEKKSLPRAETISQDLIRYIISHGLKAGDKLPNEYELTQILNVGRSTVREGVKALISRNILEIRRGAGTYVSDKQGVAEDPLGLTFVHDKYKLAQDMIEVRILLEPMIAAKAAEYANDVQRKEILQLCDEVEALILNGENHLHKDIEMHTAIANCSNNVVMPKLIPIINSSVLLFGEVTKLSLKNETIETHRSIVEAIVSRRSVEAMNAMYMHLAYNKRNIDMLVRELAKDNGDEI